MKNMTLPQIAAACNGQLYKSNIPEDKVAAGVVLDSRKVEKDYIFIATVGERVDGHSFISEVFDRGAMAVICEKVPTECKGPYILVKNSFTALKDIAIWYRSHLDIKVVGITGSVGKTSTKEFISSVLSQKYKVLKTEGNYNNEIGLPLTILKITSEHKVAVLEMGISDFGEMHRLSEMAQPDICVLTNIGLCHLENLGSRQGILRAKSEIFDYMNEKGAIIINGDDDLLTTIKEVKGIKPIKFGLGMNHEIYATNIISNGLLGSSCDVHVHDTVFHANIPLPGEHMVLNALAATSVGILLGLTAEDIRAGIEAVKPLGGRSNIVRKNNITVIDDCYNANPQSMRAAIDLLCTSATRKVAILGDMFELGASEKLFHQEVGLYIASKSIDVLICIGSLSQNIYEGALHNVVNTSDKTVLHFNTRDELILLLPDMIERDDTILVKASHGMGFDTIVEALLK